MSDEPNSHGNGGDWKMPAPVFQSSEGRTPKTAKNYVDPADDIDTASPNSGEFDADLIDTETPNREEEPTLELDIESETEAPTDPTDDVEVDAEAEAVEIPAQAKPKTKNGCASSMLTVLSILAVVVIAIVVVLGYFLFYYKPAETGTF